MSSAGRRSSQQHCGFCTDQHGGIVVLTVCDALLLLNGRGNNRSHSSPARLCSHSQLLYLWRQMRGVPVCLYMHVKFVSFRECFGSSASACSVHACLCVAWLCAMPSLSAEELVRAWLYMGELTLDDTVMAPCWAAPSSASKVGLYWPPTWRIDEGKDKLQEKQPSGGRKRR